MPLVFVHGVNVRKDDQYDRNVASRNTLFQRLLLDPLSDHDSRFKQVKIVNPYWGDLGVRLAWDGETIPPVSALELMGELAEGGPTTADLELLGTVCQLSAASCSLERLGDSPSLLKQAAQRDPQRFLEAVLSRVGLSEISLQLGPQDSPEQVGQRQALLIEATRDVSQSPQTKSTISQAANDEQMVDELREALATRFEELLARAPAAPSAAAFPPDAAPDIAAEGLELLGPPGGPTLRDRLKELFDRTLEAPARVASSAVLSAYRDRVTHAVTQFLGDVFIYQQTRGTCPDTAGPIGDLICNAIRDARKNEPSDSPLIVVTHSMGGNILYDLLTFYRPELKLDFWASVAAQVGMLEEMKVFKTSNPAVRRPQTVGLGNFRQHVKKWCNIYDPNDVLSFLAKPVFGDAVTDLPYSSGTGFFDAHGAYFQRASFYQTLLSQLN